jgi:hypothetical protein
MSNAFTLDDLNKTLEKKYGPFVFKAGKETFTMVQVLRLPREKREVVKTLLQTLEDQKENLNEDQTLDILKEVTKNVLIDNSADDLFELLGNDLVKVTVLFEQWAESTQAGEA